MYYRNFGRVNRTGWCRIPVLKKLFALPISTIVRVNFLISFITLSATLAGRAFSGFKIDLLPLLPVIISLTVVSITGAYLGSMLLNKISEEKLERIIVILLIFIGILLIVESIWPMSNIGIAAKFPLNIAVGVILGIGIGIVSSTLGVAGGELIIPSLILIFGIEAKTAGTSSVLISLPTVLTDL